jgi:hypothetical protein
MTSPEYNKNFPHVTDDDFLAAFIESDEERWKELAEHQPEVARAIEQRANRIRIEIESKSASPLELQKEIIDTTTFIIGAIAHALEAKNQSQPSHSDNIGDEDSQTLAV